MDYGRERISGQMTFTRIQAREIKFAHLFLVYIACCFALVVPSIAAAASWSPDDVLKTYIHDHYPWADVDITVLQVSGELPSSSPIAVLVEKTPPGKSVFRFEFRSGKSVLVMATIKAFDRVFMSRSGFRRGYVLQRDDVYSTLMESDRIPKGALRDEEQVIGKPLLRSIVSNVPLTDDMVSEMPLVKRGHKVVLSIESSGFSIKAMGETKQDAPVGEYVKVINLSSHKVVTGMLIDANTVRVEY